MREPDQVSQIRQPVEKCFSTYSGAGAGGLPIASEIAIGAVVEVAFLFERFLKAALGPVDPDLGRGE